jgi:uncharacterized protein YndB with AHSA1/START domain
MTDLAPATDLVITRVFAAPRPLVYQAFIDPDQLAQWFGPVGYSVPRDTVSIEARAGGHQRFVMVNDADPGQRSPVDATFTEVVENELLVGEQRWEGVPGVQDGGVMSLRLEFADVDGGTELTLRQGPYGAELESMARAGWTSSFTKLDVLLAGGVS